MNIKGHAAGVALAFLATGAVRLPMDVIGVPYWVSFISGFVAAVATAAATYDWRERKFPKEDR
jgi:hypothetical protein